MSHAASVLVTGATGFIGQHLVRRLLSDGCHVTSLQRSQTAVAGVQNTVRVEQFTTDKIAGALRGHHYDRLFHLAAYGVNFSDRSRADMFRVNVEVTRHLVEAAADGLARSVVIVGSGSEYDLSGVDRPISELHPLQSSALYGTSKAAGSLCALATARAAGVPLAVGRLFGVYGPGEAPHRLLTSLLNGFAQGKRVPLSHGLQIRDVIYVDEAVEALLVLAGSIENKPQQGAFNICSGLSYSVRDFAEAVAEAAGAPHHLLGFDDIATRADDVPFFVGDPARFKALTGWSPQLDLRLGVRQAVLAARGS